MFNSGTHHGTSQRIDPLATATRLWGSAWQGSGSSCQGTAVRAGNDSLEGAVVGVVVVVVVVVGRRGRRGRRVGGERLKTH